MASVSCWQGRSVCVTGGRGFLGSRIVAQLQAAGAQVVSASRATGCDLTRLDQAVAFFTAHKPEIVFNCAAHQGGIRYQQLYPATVMLDNLLMGAYAMEAARQVGVKKYVNVVAACSYPGYLDNEVLREDDYWDGPLHDSVVNYGITKKVQTVQGLMYQRQYGMHSIHMIMTNLYGPGEHFHPDRSHALAALTRRFYEAKRDGSPTVEVWGTGRPVREWMYVDDAAAALIRAAEVYEDVSPLNIGMGEGYTISELANIIKEVVGYEGESVYDTSKLDGALRKVMSTERMMAALNWEPQVPIREGIRLTLGWLIENYEEAINK